MKTLIATIFSVMLLIPSINKDNTNTADKIDITVTIQGLRSGNGTIGVALHNEDSDFPEDEGIELKKVSLDGSGDVEVTFKNVPAGDYAVAVMHDENSNGDIDFNEYGMPTEGFGFSNDAMGDMGPPDFDDAAFTAEDDTDISVSLIYMGS